MADVLGVNRSVLRTQGQKKLSFWLRWKFQYFLSLRVNHTPISYIRGWKDWCGFRVSVSPSVLIPRDETEVLIEMIGEREVEPRTILDMGTGSGCIAIALAKKFPNAKVSAIDISRAALSVAKKNFRNHRLDIDAQYSDLLSSLPIGASFDLIVANLPYVPQNTHVTKEVRQEPYEAVFSGNDGLDILRQFAQELEQKEIQFQSVWLEFLPSQWKQIQVLFKNWKVEPVQDLGGDIYFARIT